MFYLFAAFLCLNCGIILHYWCTWFRFSGLCLNPSKSETILLGTCQHLLSFPTVPIVNITSSPVTDQITTLGIVIDKYFTFDSHVSAFCQKFFLSLHHEAHTTFLTDDMAASVASAAVVLSRLDYSNSLLCVCSVYNMKKPQRIQNTAARIVLIDTQQLCHSEQLLQHLHWIPVYFRIKYKIATLTYKVSLQINHCISLICSLLVLRVAVSSLRISFSLRACSFHRHWQSRLQLCSTFNME